MTTSHNPLTEAKDPEQVHESWLDFDRTFTIKHTATMDAPQSLKGGHHGCTREEDLDFDVISDNIYPQARIFLWKLLEKKNKHKNEKICILTANRNPWLVEKYLEAAIADVLFERGDYPNYIEAREQARKIINDNGGIDIHCSWGLQVNTNNIPRESATAILTTENTDKYGAFIAQNQEKQTQAKVEVLKKAVAQNPKHSYHYIDDDTEIIKKMQQDDILPVKISLKVADQDGESLKAVLEDIFGKEAAEEFKEIKAVPKNVSPPSQMTSGSRQSVQEQALKQLQQALGTINPASGPKVPEKKEEHFFLIPSSDKGPNSLNAFRDDLNDNARKQKIFFVSCPISQKNKHKKSPQPIATVYLWSEIDESQISCSVLAEPHPQQQGAYLIGGLKFYKGGDAYWFDSAEKLGAVVRAFNSEKLATREEFNQWIKQQPIVTGKTPLQLLDDLKADVIAKWGEAAFYGDMTCFTLPETERTQSLNEARDAAKARVSNNHAAIAVRLSSQFPANMADKPISLMSASSPVNIAAIEYWSEKERKIKSTLLKVKAKENSPGEHEWALEGGKWGDLASIWAPVMPKETSKKQDSPAEEKTPAPAQLANEAKGTSEVKNTEQPIATRKTPLQLLDDLKAAVVVKWGEAAFYGNMTCFTMPETERAQSLDGARDAAKAHVSNNHETIAVRLSSKFPADKADKPISLMSASSPVNIAAVEYWHQGEGKVKPVLLQVREKEKSPGEYEWALEGGQWGDLASIWAPVMPEKTSEKQDSHAEEKPLVSTQPANEAKRSTSEVKNTEQAVATGKTPLQSNTVNEVKTDNTDSEVKKTTPNTNNSAFFTPATPKQGAPSEHPIVYLFPRSPDSYHFVDENKTALLATIYKRMQDLIQKDREGKNTSDKFEALKKLYNSQADLLRKDDFSGALENMRQWKSSNKEIIAPLRAQSKLGKFVYLFYHYPSSTASMADKLEKRLEKEEKAHQAKAPSSSI